LLGYDFSSLRPLVTAFDLISNVYSTSRFRLFTEFFKNFAAFWAICELAQEKLYGPPLVVSSARIMPNPKRRLLARRLIERGVRVVQIFHRGGDQHNNLPPEIRAQRKDVDQICAALIKELKQDVDKFLIGRKTPFSYTALYN
jgi:Protein of unknown function (DUF1501)